MLSRLDGCTAADFVIDLNFYDCSFSCPLTPRSVIRWPRAVGELELPTEGQCPCDSDSVAGLGSLTEAVRLSFGAPSPRGQVDCPCICKLSCLKYVIIGNNGINRE